ncbi:hypothetical protein HYT24_03400 [Candidatus Pacearchaeota archaeon]|nr:hypothetical protein [Candidatus Pacearchaeota archaeon]
MPERDLTTDKEKSIGLRRKGEEESKRSQIEIKINWVVSGPFEYIEEMPEGVQNSDLYLLGRLQTLVAGGPRTIPRDIPGNIEISYDKRRLSYNKR